MKHNELDIAYQQHYQPLFLYAYSLTKNKADAEDLVANAFVNAFLSFTTGNIKSWLYRVLKNEFLNMVKKKKFLLDEGSIPMSYIQDTYNMLEDLVIEERKRWIYSKMYSLPKQEQEILLLSIHANFKDEDIAQMMGISITNIRVLRHRAKKRLMDLCKKEGLYNG